MLKQDCQFCSILTSEQHAQLSTPTYKIKKDKKSNKKASSPSPVDPSSVLVLSQVGEKKIENTTQPAKEKPKKSIPSKASNYSKDLKEPNQKWSERLSRLPVVQ